jgi:hypothetical protein
MLHGTDMNENIVPALIRGNEAIAFAGVEPSHHAGLRLSLRRGLGVLHRFHVAPFFAQFYLPVLLGLGHFAGSLRTKQNLSAFARIDQFQSFCCIAADF